MDTELEGNPIRRSVDFLIVDVMWLMCMFVCRRFRLKWPWEQDRQMAVYNSSSHLIQGLLASF